MVEVGRAADAQAVRSTRFVQKFLCKAMLDRDQVTTTGLDWAVSTRCRLEVGDSHFRIGDRELAFSEIESSTLQKVPSAFFWPGYVFSIKMNDGASHHFGLVYSRYWGREFPFPVARVTAKVPLLWTRRLIVAATVCCVAYKLILRSMSS